MFNSVSFSLRPLAVVLAAATLAGCADRSPTAASGSDPLQPTDGSSWSVQPMDAEINQYDTWVTYDAVRERTSVLNSHDPLFDARTDQYVNEISTVAPSQTLHVEAGYDSYGTVRVNEYRQASGLDPYETPVDETHRIQVIGSYVYAHDAGGDMISAGALDGSEPPLAELGSLDGAQVTEGAVRDERSFETTTAYGLRPSYSRAGTGTHVERVGGDRLRETTVITPDASLVGTNASSAQHETRLVRTYVKRGDKWILQEMEVTAKGGTDRVATQTREVTRLTNVTWHENKEKDAQRRAIRERAKASTSKAPLVAPPAGPRLAEATCVVDEYGNPCQPESGGGTGGGDSTGSVDPCANTDPNGRDVVFQHGFMSAAETWSRMSPWMSDDFHLGCKLAYSLTWKDRLPTQADTLRNRIRSHSTDSFLFIGHSNGGMISRVAAQKYPDLVSGVVTIGSPHLGAPLANNKAAVLSAALTGLSAWGYSTCPKDWGLVCGGVALFASATIPLLVKFGADDAIPAFNDMKPGSNFHNTLNGAQEPFPRVGIQSYSKRLFVEWRVYGDMKDGPDGPAGGRYQVRKAKAALATDVGCGVVGVLIGAGPAAANCAKRAAYRLAVTGFWNVAVSGFDKSDGIVPGKSQMYPNAFRNYGIPDGDSHVGETKSDRVRKELRKALFDDMKVTKTNTW